jgi:hypothetical protein
MDGRWIRLMGIGAVARWKAATYRWYIRTKTDKHFIGLLILFRKAGTRVRGVEALLNSTNEWIVLRRMRFFLTAENEPQI